MKKILNVLFSTLLSVSMVGQTIHPAFVFAEEEEISEKQEETIESEDQEEVTKTDEKLEDIEEDSFVEDEEDEEVITIENEESGTCGENVNWHFANGVLTISGSGDIIFIDDLRCPWADIRDRIEKVLIEYGVTSIGFESFCGCSSLTSISIPNSITTIEGSAFSDCSSLANISIPDSVTSIGEGAFSGCIGLEKINVDKNNTVYDSRNDCNAIIRTDINELIVGCKNTNIPDSVTSIGSSAFFDCSSLTSIIIPESVTDIGFSAFCGCISLTSITIPNSVTSIWLAAFCGCSSLTSITIPNGVTEIGYGLFSYCSSLTSITIPDSVTNIDDRAFDECENLKDVYFNGNKKLWNSIRISKFDNDAFYNANIHFIGISFDCYDLELTKGKTHTLIVTNNMEEVITIDWFSSDSSIVEVSNGTITAKGYGTAKVTAIASNGYTATCNVTVPDTEYDTNKSLIYTSPNWPDNYSNNVSTESSEKEFTFDGAEKIKIEFDKTSVTEGGYDYVYIYNKDGEKLYSLSGSTFAKDTYVIEGDYVKIAFYSDDSTNYKGFSATITPAYKISEPESSLLEGYSLSLNGSIGVNFYMLLKDCSDTDYMEFTLPNGFSKTISVKDAKKETVAGKEYTVFTCNISAKDMTGNIKAQMKSGNENIGEEYIYSVEDYANYLMDHSEQFESKYVSIAKAMLTYGKYVQEYFEYNTSEVPSKVNSISSVDLESYAYQLIDRNSSLDFVGARLILTTKPGLKLYFTGNGNFMVDGQNVSTTTEGKYTVVTITDNDDMEEMYYVTAEKFALCYGIFSYGNQANNTSNTKLKNLIYAMYAYDQALKS